MSLTVVLENVLKFEHLTLFELAVLNILLLLHQFLRLQQHLLVLRQPDLLLDLVPLDHLIPVLLLLSQLVLSFEDAGFEGVEILLEEFVFDPLQRGNSENFDNHTSDHSVDNQGDKRVSGHMHHDQAADNSAVVIVFEDQHCQSDTDCPLETSEG